MDSCSDDTLEAYAPPDFSKVQVTQLEREAQRLRRELRSGEERLERLSAGVQLAKQQIDFFTQETQKAQEGIKDACWRFTKEVCAELARIKSPSPVLLEVGEKFLLILEQRDRSWKTFRAICLNYTPLKALMNSIQADRFSEEQMSELLPVWKNQQTLMTKLSKVAKGGSILAEWICSCVEFKLRKETLLASQQKLPDLERKVRTQMQSIAEKNAQILVQEEQIQEAQAAFDSSLSSEEEPARPYQPKSLNISVVSITSTNHSVKPSMEDRAVNTVPLRRGTATGGLLFLMSPRDESKKTQSAEFPNFGSGELYRDAPASPPREEGFRIEMEGGDELAGCCRSRFFCY